MRQLGAVRREGRVQGDAPALAQPADTWVHAVARHHGRALARVRSAKTVFIYQRKLYNSRASELW